MKKKIILVLLAVAAGMVAAVVGVHVERIDYVVCDGVLHIEMNQYWGMKKSSIAYGELRGIMRKEKRDEAEL